MSSYLANALVLHALGKTTFTMPASVDIALTTVTPVFADTGSTITEATYTGYARANIPASSLNAASGGVSTNSVAITFAACTAGSSTVQSWAICDSVTTAAGNMLLYGTTSSQVIASGNTPNVPIGSLSITFS